MALAARKPVPDRLTDEQQHALDFADAALAVAGHEVSDPYLRELLTKQASVELSVDEAVAQVNEYLDSKYK